MGYTHYWKTGRDISKAAWSKIARDAKTAIVYVVDNLAQLANEYDEPGTIPAVTDEFIRFNGVGDEGHETFRFTRLKTSFEFCKTARKPYDIAVCLILLIAQEHSSNVVASSDGDADDWKQAIELFAQIFGKAPKRLIA
jgi:hypothetical protein